MKNRTLELREKQTALSDLEKQLSLLQDKVNTVKTDMFDLNSERLHYLRTWYNNRLDMDGSIMRTLDPISIQYLPDYQYVIAVIKSLLHKQTLNNATYRTERKLYRSMASYINNHSYEYVTHTDVKRLVEKYKTQNAEHLIKKLDLERKLQFRKNRLIEITVGDRGARRWERRNMTDTDRANFWYNATMQNFVRKTTNKFEKLLNDNGIKEYYGIIFERYSSDVKRWHESITKTHTMTLGQLKAKAYRQIKERYLQNVRRHNSKHFDTMQEVAREKHELATMTAKERKQVQFEKWSKVKKVLNMFSGAIEIDKKITFDNYVPEQAEPTLTTVKQVINNCGLVENHETYSDGTTRIALYV